MDNLFGIFDPHRSFGLIKLVWGSSAFSPPLKILSHPQPALTCSKINYYSASLGISISLGALATPGITWFSISLFIIVATINYLGLIPYVFTPTRHLRFTLRLAILV